MLQVPLGGVGVMFIRCVIWYFDAATLMYITIVFARMDLQTDAYDKDNGDENVFGGMEPKS